MLFNQNSLFITYWRVSGSPLGGWMNHFFPLFCSLLLLLLSPTIYLVLLLSCNWIWMSSHGSDTWKGISRFSAGFPLILPYVYINGHTMAATLQKMYWFKLHTSIYFSTKLAENRQIHVCIHIADGRMVFDIYPYCVYYVCNCRTFLYVVPKLLFY